MKRTFTILLLSIFAINIFAAEPDSGVIELTLPKAVKMAFKSSKDLQISKENLEKAWNTYYEVKASIFPQVNGEVSVTNFFDSPVLTIDMGTGLVDIPIKQKWESSASLTLSQVVWAFGKILNSIDVGKKSIKLQEYSKDIAQNSIIFGVKQAYLSMLYAEVMINIAEDSYNNALKNKQALKTRFQGGRISQVYNIKMEADIASRVPVVLNAKKTYDLMAISFSDLIGVEGNPGLNLNDYFIREFPAYDYEKLVADMVENEPSLKLLRKKVDLNDSMIKLKKSAFYPTLSGFVNYSYSGQGDEIYPKDSMQDSSFAGLSLNVPIWDSGAKSNSFKQAKKDKNIAELEYDKRLKTLKVELNSSLLEYNSLVETYKANKRAQELAESAYNITLDSFMSGAVSQTALNDAELALTRAKIESVSTLYNINVLIAKIEKLTKGSEGL